MKEHESRKVSAGTWFMLVLTALVLFSSVLVLIRLSSGNSIDLKRIRTDTASVGNTDQGPKEAEASSGRTEAAGHTNVQQAPQTEASSAKNNASPTQNAQAAGGAFTITVAGTVAVEGEIRKNSYISEVKTYDLSDIMTLLKNEVRSDLNIAFLENRLGGEKVSDTVAPESACAMLKEAGFGIIAGGYTKAWEKDSGSVASTCSTLQEYGLTPVGIYHPDHSNAISVRTYGGVRTIVLQYTDTIQSGVRNTMKKAGASETVPAADSEQIASDIRKAREMGAEAVIVLVNWGKIGKNPDKNQKSLAQAIADAGADLIIGSGSRVPQGAEYLSASRADGSQSQVLCVWCLGTTLSGERGSAKRIAGYLFHAEIVSDGKGGAVVRSPSYTPLYTWKYKQDGRYYYRCIPANRTAPDGMDTEQIKTMGRAKEATETALAGSPLAEQ